MNRFIFIISFDEWKENKDELSLFKDEFYHLVIRHFIFWIKKQDCVLLKVMANRTSLHTIIHSFALLHALTAVLCHTAGINDNLALTTLTMTLALIICLREKAKVEYSALSIVLVNIFGYIIGVGIGIGINKVMVASEFSSAIATFLTTELLGWALSWFTTRYGNNEPNAKDSSIWRSQIGWLITAVLGIFAFRIFLTIIFSGDSFESEAIFNALIAFFNNTSVFLTLIFLTIFFVRYIKKTDWSVGAKAIFTSACIVMCSVLSCFAVGYNIPQGPVEPIAARELFELFLVSIIAESAIYGLTQIADYAISIRNAVEIEKNKTSQAKFQYLNLKQQLNPHFLFNSLNILDALVNEGSKEEASTYIHKLSGVYRYMLKNEEATIISLDEEMEYVSMYTDLLKVRFQEGLEINFNIKTDDRDRYVVPCSVQLLIENATKHNSISPENPLIITVDSDGESICVRNNLIPKLSSVQSTGLGLTYIKQQYLERSGKAVTIIKNEKEYIVTIPLL